jgi:hypothetical protein
MSRYNKLLDGKNITYIALDVSGYNYYLFTSIDKSWVILRENIAGTEYSYAVGSSDSNTAWTNKTLCNYKLPTEFSL